MVEVVKPVAAWNETYLLFAELLKYNWFELYILSPSLKLLSPYIVWESGEIKPVVAEPANGILKVCVEPDDDMLNSDPE